MSQRLDEETPITAPTQTVTAPTVQATTPVATPAAPSAPEVPAAPEKETEEKKPTIYVVLAGESEKGPWQEIGNFEGHGQTAAKKAAVTALTERDTDANAFWFIAIPVSSYVPEKPQVKVVTSVSF